jgi:hypothetical protein
MRRDDAHAAAAGGCKDEFGPAADDADSDRSPAWPDLGRRPFPPGLGRAMIATSGGSILLAEVGPFHMPITSHDGRLRENDNDLKCRTGGLPHRV